MKSTLMPPYRAEAIANEYIKMSLKGELSDLTPMKLQKMVYYTHGWYLAFFGKPLISDTVQAWEYGPVIRSLYSEFRDFGNTVVTELASEMTFSEENELVLVTPRVFKNDKDTWHVINEVKKIYGKYTAIQLSNLTHMEGTPWYLVTQQYKSETNGKIPHDLDIPNNFIKLKFLEDLQGANNGQ